MHVSIIFILQVLQDAKEHTKMVNLAPTFIVNLILDIPSKYIIHPRDSTKAKCRAKNNMCMIKSKLSYDPLELSNVSREMDCSLLDTTGTTSFLKNLSTAFTFNQ